MGKRWKSWLIAVVVGITLIGANVGHSAGTPKPAVWAPAPGELTPENTVILANTADAQFAQDFSVLLKLLRLEWITVGDSGVPDAIRDKNIILIGRLESQYTGDILRDLLAEVDIAQVQANESVTAEQESPWGAGRRVILCVGDDQLQMRDAAEKAVRALIADAPPASDWQRSRFEAPLDSDMRDYVDYLRFTWEDAELPVAGLMIDVDAKPQRVSAAEAAEDAGRLFYLFSHGYAGYAFFNTDNAFDSARTRIADAIASRSHWSNKDLAALFHEQLNFITDCHLKIGDYQYAGHADFWHNTQMTLALNEAGYQFTSGGKRYTVKTVNAQSPEPFVFPSLDAQGQPVYRLGMLSESKPAALDLVAISVTGEERRFKIGLQHPNFVRYTDSIFQEQTLGGIPVLRIRSFSDHHADDIRRFVETASTHKGTPAIIIDLRGNGGGNETWPIQWIQGLTGERAEAVFVVSELHSRTTMVGRANVFAYMYDRYPKTSSYKTEWERFTANAQSYENNVIAPTWNGPLYPTFSLIPNDTTLIIVTNEYVASAGEGMVMRASRAENVVVVGENTMGCLTFGNAGTFQLPHSNMLVHLPINFGVYPDGEFREGTGLSPDFWVPAADAVNYAVAAVRNGTLTTAQPLPPETLEQPFKPENPWVKEIVFSVLCAIGAVTWTYFMRHKAGTVTATGVLWTVVGGVMLMRDKPPGQGLLLAGGICLVGGAIALWQKRRAMNKVTAL